ncbi:glyoxalase superfamily protein [Bacillus cereus group sp. RP37]|uniref:glyoxalase superfamily protein n=1 Tax=Bacillus cereus group sp. RP37 TaxID=3040259 RepID=UPI000330F8DA|nr:glyoxalase [Bacillus cereus BAG3O-1]PFF83944.1 VOC family protein [Bacillus cereus]HDX9671429.1 VOC family protein [Bacillus cereus]HDX9672708.1 VOC family protein [Bacillus cereus]
MITPIFRIFDVEKAKLFYLDFLGFKMDWEHRYEEHMPLYMQISLHDAVIHLSEHHGDASPGGAIRVKIEDLKSYYAILSSKDYAYSKPDIESTPWDTMELTVIDPFSNRIIFYEEKV